MIDLDEWQKIYMLMRCLDVSAADATKVANIITKECRVEPDDHEEAKRAREFLARCKAEGKNLVEVVFPNSAVAKAKAIKAVSDGELKPFLDKFDRPIKRNPNAQN